MTVRARSNSGTIPANGLFEKCPLSHCRFPCRSTILSIPDCKNKIARNAETSNWSRNTDITRQDYQDSGDEENKPETQDLGKGLPG